MTRLSILLMSYRATFGYPFSQLCDLISHFTNLGGTVDTKESVSLTTFAQEKQQYVDSFEKRKHILCVKYHGYGSGVGCRTGPKIAGQQDTEPNMEECSYSGTVRSSDSKPSRTSKIAWQPRAKMSELQLQG